eukprot:TRINITY_DN3497_c0_g2_i1.p1 TRINITY_DN3497_c0_g2~~TRINITY_DN3497_c0_g2_i1.p1  ORF type:complete len:131 (+),score=29.72 TRINITY_DN3497_c0_g2_i1:84-476(+)
MLAARLARFRAIKPTSCGIAQIPMLGKPQAAQLRLFQTGSRFFSTDRSDESKPQTESQKASEEAARAQKIWESAVPEMNWDFRSPVIIVMVIALIVLQVMISTKQSSVAEKEQDEIAKIKAERQAERERR